MHPSKIYSPCALTGPTTFKRVLIIAISSVLLVGCIVLSLAVGSSTIPLNQVIDYLQHPDASHESYIINGMRQTRTLIGILVGLSLAVAGAVMQAITRNPLADPGLLGVNSGASLAIVLGATVGVAASTASQVLLAFFGALAASALVYLIGHTGVTAGSPLRLVLAGIAFSTASGGVISALLIINPQVFNTFRFWDVGALTRNDVSLWSLALPIAVGLTLILFITPALSSLALGDEVATSLGTNIVLTRACSLIALTLLCASATAAAGPISFVGLMVPYIAGALIGESRGWIIAACAVMGPVLVLSADVLGRVIMRPAEMQVGLLTAFMGSPVLLYLVFTMKGAK